MKKTFLSSAMLMLVAFASFGQSSAIESASQIKAAKTDIAFLSIRLFPIQTIEVNASQKDVYLDYRTKMNYFNGVDLNQPNHLTIYSTGGFVVKVNSSTPNLQNQTGTYIPASDVSITTVAGGKNPFLLLKPNTISLSDKAQPLFSSNTGGVNKTVTINYKAKGADAYVNKYINNEDPSVYTTEVVYVIEAI